MPRHFIKRRRRATPSACLPIPFPPEAEASTELPRKMDEPMQKLLSLLQSLSDHVADFGRNCPRRILKRVLLMSGLTLGYVVAQPAGQAALWNSFKSVILEMIPSGSRRIRS